MNPVQLSATLAADGKLRKSPSAAKWRAENAFIHSVLRE
jgi:hypothetical protein